MMAEVERATLERATLQRSSMYVRGVGSACARGGCQAAALTEVADTAARLAGEMIARGEQQVRPTQALWCEQGGHSFSEKDRGQQVITINGIGGDGEPAEESRTACGPCAVRARTTLGTANNSAAAPLPPGGGGEYSNESVF